MHLLGDPHLGRSFINGVPLARRGERERMQRLTFVKSLMAGVKGNLHICMGDLFDKAIVSYSLILNAAYDYAVATQAYPNTLFVILKGNHDWQRDLEKPSAFDVFTKLVSHIPNVKVVDEYWSTQNLGFVAWHPTIPAEEMVGYLNKSVDTVFGHWDIESYGGEDVNLIPTKALAARGIMKAYTGHIHKPQTFNRDGVEVVVTGSMQPYAHGEEIDETLYRTVTKKELLAADAGAFHNHCLRVHLAPGEILDVDVDCLQLTIKKDKVDDEQPTVQLGDFDMAKLFEEAFNEAGVSKETTQKMVTQYEASRISDG